MKTSALRLFTLTALLLAVTTFSGVAEARGPMGHDGYGRGMYNGPTLTVEQQTAAQNIFTEHDAATESIRQQIMEKRSELNAHMYSATPDTAKIERLSKEIGALQGKMLAERTNLNAQLTKQGIPANAAGYGMNHMEQGRGMGRGYGNGMNHGSGMGYGSGMNHGTSMNHGSGMNHMGNW